MQQYNLNGIMTFAFPGKEELIDFAIERKGILVAVNAEKIMRCEARLLEIINSNIGYSDGVGAVWALKKKGAKKPVKIPGVELWHAMVSRKYKEKTFYLLGGKDEVIEKAVQQLRSEFPRIKILGYHNGYLKEGETEEIKKDLLRLNPDIVFVAMGSPRQEYLMGELYSVHKALYQGLGGSFDVYTGTVKRAPAFFVKAGLEWFYRLMKEPKRFKRQLILIPFAFRLLIGKL